MLLLLDTVVNFKKNMYRIYSLDPLNFVTLPSFSRESALKIIGIELELLEDIVVILDYENGIRRGKPRVILHYADANKNYMLIYAESKGSAIICCFN